MEITIKAGDNIPPGKYELSDPSKLENAKSNLSFKGSERDLLLEYDRIAGCLVRNKQILPPASIWQIEKAHEQRSIESFTDDELRVVMRRAENTNVAGSLYQRASNEWALRKDLKMIAAATREKWSSDKLPLGYPATCNSDLIREVVEDLVEDKRSRLLGGKVNAIWEKVIDDLIKNGQKELEQRRAVRKWHERPFGLILIGVLIGQISILLNYAVPFIIHIDWVETGFWSLLKF